MNTHRRDTDRETAESVERIWRIYADQVGIPKAGSRESLPQQSDDAMQGRRLARVMAGVARLLAALAVVVVVAIAGIVLWLESSSSPGTAGHRSPTLASAPAREADRTPPSSAVVRPDATQTSGTLSTDTKQESTDGRYRINFDFGSDRINNESKRALGEIVTAMNANPEWRVAIEGHTDAHGTPDYNRALSERRAQAVKIYLQSAGIAPGRLSAVGFGASRPVAPNTAPGNVVNRRVEFHRQ